MAETPTSDQRRPVRPGADSDQVDPAPQAAPTAVATPAAPDTAPEAQVNVDENPVTKQKRKNINVDVPDLPEDVKVSLTDSNVNIVSVGGVDYDFKKNPTQEVTAPVAALLVETGVVEAQAPEVTE